MPSVLLFSSFPFSSPHSSLIDHLGRGQDEKHNEDGWIICSLKQDAAGVGSGSLYDRYLETAFAKSSDFMRACKCPKLTESKTKTWHPCLHFTASFLFWESGGLNSGPHIF
jgi:hypothetical protein